MFIFYFIITFKFNFTSVLTLTIYSQASLNIQRIINLQYYKVNKSKEILIKKSNSYFFFSKAIVISLFNIYCKLQKK